MVIQHKILLRITGSLVFVFILAVVLYFSAATLINSDSAKEKLHAYLLEKTGASIAYNTSELHLFPLPIIIFHEATVSVPGKAHGSVKSLRVYPDLWSLMRGGIGNAEVGLDAPHLIVKISELKEKPSLEQIEEKIRSVVHYLVSTAPGLRIVVGDGKLDLTEEDRTAFLFDLIQLRLSASQKKLGIELTSRSNLCDSVSISSSIQADDLKSEGTIRLTHLRPDILIARLIKETTGKIGVSDALLSVQFETLGLKMVKASMESSVSGLAISWGTRQASMGEANIKGDIEINPGSISVRIKEAMVSRPALNLSGHYILDRNSGSMTFDLKSNAIAVQPVRESALALGGDIPFIATIFTVLRGGEISALHIQSHGQSLTELGQLENIGITGKVLGGIIYIAGQDLTFQNVTGDVAVSRGIIEGSNVGASLENHQGSGGTLRIGLKGKDAPFHIDMRVRADVGQLPSLLKQHHLVKSDAVLHEIDRLRDLRGSAEGRLILGERLDSIHVKIAVDDMNISARYEPLPFALAVRGGRFSFDEKMVGIADMAGSLGSSSFTRLNARLTLTDPYNLEMTDGQVSIVADEIYPWISSFEQIRPVLKDVRSLQGVVSVSSLNFRGPLYKPKEWKYNVRGEAKGITADTAYLPAKAEDVRGQFFIEDTLIGIAGMAGRIGSSSFTRVTARLTLTAPYELEMTDGQVSISADEIYPWITSFEGIRPILKDVRSAQGAVLVSSLNLQGPLYQPKEWKFNVRGEAKGLTVDAAFLPGTADNMGGTFGITQNEVNVKNIRLTILDSRLTVSGAITNFATDDRSMALSLEGEIGQEVNAWITRLIHLPSELQMHTPFSVTDATISLDKDGNTAFAGRLLFGQETQVSLDLAKTLDTVSVREITLKDRTSDLTASIVLKGKTIDAAFKGNVTSQTLGNVLVNSVSSAASLEGDFRTHVVLEQPRQSTAEGRLKGEHIPIPWDRDMPLNVRNIELQAEGQRAVIDTAELLVGDMTFTTKGTVSILPAWYAVDLDLSSQGIDWETLEKILRSKGRPDQEEKAEFLKDLPVRGNLRIRSDFFQSQQLRWEPVQADVSFDGKTILITAKQAALCNVSMTGSVGITEQGLTIDLALSAKDLAFEPTILCLTKNETDFTGTFEMEARLKGVGKIDEIADKLDGAFTLSAKDGKIFKAKSLDTTLDLLNESANFKGKFPDLNREIISYNALKVRGSIREHRIQIDEGTLDASIMGILASGYFDLHDRTLDFNALVAPFRTVDRIIKKIPIIGYILGGNLSAVPVRISGKMQDPRVTFLSPSAVGSELLGIVGRTIKLPVTLVEPIFPARGKESQ